MLIDELTPEQEAMIDVVAKRFSDLSKSTTPLPEDKTEIMEAVKMAYKAAGEPEPTQFFFFKNPVEMCNWAKDQGDPAPLSGMLGGSFNAGWLSFYTFFREVVKVPGLDDIEGLVRLVGKISLWITYDDVVLISQNPKEVYINERGFHNPDGPAVRYEAGADGSGEFILYYMNNIKMPEWIINTPAGNLDAKKIMAIQNVDVRREALRKIGPQRLMEQLDAKTLDKQVITEDNKQQFGLTELRKNGMSYDLLEMNFGNGMICKYLKMDNPSIDATHIEGVPNACNTVWDALNFRNQKAMEALGLSSFVPPVILT